MLNSTIGPAQIPLPLVMFTSYHLTTLSSVVPEPTRKFLQETVQVFQISFIFILKQGCEQDLRDPNCAIICFS